MPTIAALPISLPAPPQAPPQVKSQTNDEQKTFAAELKQAFDRHMKSLEAIVPQANHSPDAKQTRVVDQVAEAVVLEQGFPSRSGQSTQSGHTRTDEDNEGGTALLGFLSSLRQSYENVLRDKQRFEGGKSESSYDTTSNRAANVTDSNSTQQRDSSVDDSDWNSDWNSDKKTDPSSSEDSDKEVNVRDKKTCSSRGPPRKRMKVKKVADEIRKGVCKLKSISLCSQSTLDTNK